MFQTGKTIVIGMLVHPKYYIKSLLVTIILLRGRWIFACWKWRKNANLLSLPDLCLCNCNWNKITVNHCDVIWAVSRPKYLYQNVIKYPSNAKHTMHNSQCIWTMKDNLKTMQYNFHEIKTYIWKNIRIFYTAIIFVFNKSFLNVIQLKSYKSF